MQQRLSDDAELLCALETPVLCEYGNDRKHDE